MEIKPIADIHTDFHGKFGIPRQSGRVDGIKGEIVFRPEYRDKAALREIEGFSHLWLIFDFSEAHTDKFSPTVRPPRLGGNRRVGVFASRSPYRPNSLGLSAVKLLEVKDTEDRGTVLIVGGADLLDGTPIYDIKPYLPSSDIKPDAVGGYADGETNHRLTVKDPKGLLTPLPDEMRKVIDGCLSDDPRPSYQSDDREYGMTYGKYNVRFTVHGGEAEIVEFNETE